MIWLVPVVLGVLAATVHEILQKKVLDTLEVFDYLKLRSVFMLVFLTFLFPFVTVPSLGVEAAFIAFSGVCMAVATVGFSKAVKHEEISTIQPLANLNPLIVTVLAFIFLDESLSHIQVGGILLLLVGTYILNIHGVDKGVLEPFRAIYNNYYTKIAVISLFFFAFAATSSRFVTTAGTDPFTYTVFSWIISCVLIIIFSSYTHPSFRIRGRSKPVLIAVAIPSFLLVVMEASFYYAVSLMSVGIIAALFRLSNLFATVQGGILFRESHLLKKTLACLVMGAGAALLVLF